MDNDELLDRVRALRAQGRSAKQIARAVGLPPAAIAPLVRTLAAEDQPDQGEGVECWVSPGWSQGLTLAPDPEWPEADLGEGGTAGLVTVLLARQDRRSRVRVVGYLIDVYCLGVKDVLEPCVMDTHALAEFTRAYFCAYSAPPLAAPVELACHLVFGAVAYARSLGFEPAAGFEAVRDHLGSWTGPSAIGFGREGKPFYIQGPHDDARAVIKTLERSVGPGNFDFLLVSM
jgi:hypothetical protein